MPPLYVYIIPFTRIKSKIPQWQNQSAKLATTKHIVHLAVEKTHMRSQSGRKKSLTKQKLLQEAPSRKRSIAALRTRCSQTSQPLEWGIHSSPTWMIGWPPQFNRRLQQAKNNIHMADYRSPIVSVRSQPLWHNVAIRSVFIVIMKRCTHLPFLSPFAILRRKHSNWQVTDASVTSKEVAGTDNGASCWL